MINKGHLLFEIVTLGSELNNRGIRTGSGGGVDLQPWLVSLQHWVVSSQHWLVSSQH
jgi:hypothetical protein